MDPISSCTAADENNSILDDKDLQACWKATSENTNPNYSSRVDKILQNLNSPAPQSYFVLRRAIHRAANHSIVGITHTHNSEEHGLQTVVSFAIKRGYKVVFPPERGHNQNAVDWDVVPLSDANSGSERREIVPNGAETTTLRTADRVLNVVREASQNQVPIPYVRIDTMVQEAKQQLSWTLGIDVRGRTSADATFLFALAGVSDERLFQMLSCISKHELRRVGQRPSFRSKYILQMMEKLAAAGLRKNNACVRDCHAVAADCLLFKNEHLDIVKLLTQKRGMSLLSPRPLLWLWRFSARQTKPKEDGIASNHVDDHDDSNGHAGQRAEPSGNSTRRTEYPNPLRIFQDNKLPLILDIGCGMGVSLLGLASTSEKGSASLGGLDFQGCNFLGADLSQLPIGYAKGISRRWGLDDRLQYMWASAEECLDLVDDYRANVALVMIQFPTPYRLHDRNADGNSQLPSGQESGFMVSTRVLLQVKRILSKSGGKLLLQSNCEDVAVSMRQVAEKVGMRAMELPQEVVGFDDQQQTLRNLEWIKQGGDRAIGSGWSAIALLPSRGTTETEVSCELQGTPIHRCLLTV